MTNYRTISDAMRGEFSSKGTLVGKAGRKAARQSIRNSLKNQKNAKRHAAMLAKEATANPPPPGLVKGETACNRIACQASLIGQDRYWNKSTERWYCHACAVLINKANPLEDGTDLCVLEVRS